MYTANTANSNQRLEALVGEVVLSPLKNTILRPKSLGFTVVANTHMGMYNPV